ncbi:MAG: hypothetical protein AAFO72_09155 [Pseudomonadota bacterium]
MGQEVTARMASKSVPSSPS